MTDFSTEMKSWLEVLKLRKGTVVLFSVAMVLMMTLFFLLVFEHRLLADQVSQFTNQVELIVEVDTDLSEEHKANIQQELAALPMVNSLDYWSAERSAEYIDNQILSGYLGFLEKNKLDFPVNPLFRIQLGDLKGKEELEKVIAEKYGNRLFVMDTSNSTQGLSFAREFVENLTWFSNLFRVLIAFQFVVLLIVSAYMTAFILSERSKGFHITQVLHISPPYTFWPAIYLTSVFSLILSLVALFISYLIIGQVLWFLALLLLVSFILLDLVLVWVGRYVIVKWSMR